MKNLTKLLALMSLAATSAMGLDAAYARVTVPKLSGIKIQRVNMPSTGNFTSGASSSSSRSSSASRSRTRDAERGVGLSWNYVSIPLEVEGKGKTADSKPDFIPNLTVELSILISQGRDKAPALLKKKLEYVDIYLSGGSSGPTTINVGAFISPSGASKLTVDEKKPEEGGDGDLEKRLIGFAIEATFNGESCLNSESPNFYVFDSAMERKLSPRWWTSSLSPFGAALYSINETPFAPFSGSHFPQSKELFTNLNASGAGDASK